MSDLIPTPSWDPVHEISTTDQVIGGPGGVANTQAQALFNQNTMSRMMGGALPFDGAFAALVGGYPIGATVMLNSGESVVSEVAGNVQDPNTDMAGWAKKNSASQIIDASGKTQQEVNDEFVQSFLFDNFGVVNPSQLNEYMGKQSIQAQIKTDGTDQTEILRAYLFAAKSLKRPLQLPSGVIVFSDTITIDATYLINGAGRDVTVLQFNNAVLNKPALSFVRGATRSAFSNLSLRDGTFGTSSGIVFSDSRTGIGSPLWKNLFLNVVVTGFNTSHIYTSANPLNGATHAHCSEMLFLNCRFSNNKVTALLQNCQAVNNTYYRCDFENFDTTYHNGTAITDANFEFFRDEAGAGVLIEAASIIGRGRWFSWFYPTGGETLFSGNASFKINDARAELRDTYYGALIEELPSGVAGTLGMDISIKDSTVVAFGAAVDLIRFGGRVNALFDNVSVALGTGRLVVRAYPTLGRSSGATTGSQANIIVKDCAHVFYERETTTPYGTYSRNATPFVKFISQRSGTTNGSYSIDSLGFSRLRYGGDIQQLSQTFGSMGSAGKLVYNLDSTSAGIAANAQLKVIMPKYGRPFKLFTFKHAQRLTSECQFKLYLVKDAASWATSGTLNLATDAILVATTPSSINKAGYFESNVELSSSVLGVETSSGSGIWTEGRMVIEYSGAVNYAGFVGIDYV